MLSEGVPARATTHRWRPPQLLGNRHLVNHRLVPPRLLSINPHQRSLNLSNPRPLVKVRNRSHHLSSQLLALLARLPWVVPLGFLPHHSRLLASFQPIRPPFHPQPQPQGAVVVVVVVGSPPSLVNPPHLVLIPLPPIMHLHQRGDLHLDSLRSVNQQPTILLHRLEGLHLDSLRSGNQPVQLRQRSVHLL